MHIESMGENKFFLLLVDDYTHMTWIFFLMSKGEAYEKFQIFQAMVKQESGKKIKILQLDKRGEFHSRAFSEYCDKVGIQRELTLPYTPQHNGTVERKKSNGYWEDLVFAVMKWTTGILLGISGSNHSLLYQHLSDSCDSKSDPIRIIDRSEIKCEASRGFWMHSNDASSYP